MLDFLTYIPIIIFGGAFIAIFFVFISGSLIFLFSNDSERGRRMVTKSLFWLLIILMMFLAFSGVTYLVKKGGIFNSQSGGEFPASPSSEFPPLKSNK